MMFQRRVVAVICFAIMATVIGRSADITRKSMPWDVCIVVQGKVDECSAGSKARPFADFLDPALWLTGPRDAFSAELQWDLKQGSETPKAVWKDLGNLGVGRVLSVRYQLGDQPFAEVVIAERSPGLFAPLMKWEGHAPPVAIERAGSNTVLVMAMNWGGMRPMMEYWAWTWGTAGPIRMDVDAAILQGIRKVAPRYSGGPDTSFDWGSLQSQTTVVESDAKGHIVGAGQLKVWFALGTQGLIVKRVELEESFGDDPKTYKWPRTSGRP
jgi:hypothetical protein